MKLKQPVRFGSFAFEPWRQVLLRDGSPVPLGRRAPAVLGALLQRRGEVLGKAELMDAGWPGLAVEEANLSVQISRLRRALGPTHAAGAWIETVQGVGYRFAPREPFAVAAASAPRLTVQRFSDFGTGSQPEADGLGADLTAVLSRFGSLTVVARDDGSGPPAVRRDAARLGRSLGAGYVLAGSVRLIGGDRTRLNVHLIDAATGSCLWAETVDRDGHGRGASDQLVARLAATLEFQIHTAETARSLADRAESASPYDLYLRARWKQRTSEEKDNAEAYRLLQAALRREPENVHFLAAAAEALHHRISVGWPTLEADDRQVSLDLAVRGVAGGRADGVALGLFGTAMFTARDWDGGQATTERGLELNPASPLALVGAALGNLWLGRNDDAEDRYERAASYGAQVPTLAFALSGLASVQRRRGNYEACIDLANRSLALRPAYSCAHWNLIAADVLTGRKDEARRHLARYLAISPDVTVASIKAGQPVVDERLNASLLDALATAGLAEA